MTIQKTVTLYTFDELSDTAKEKAREWYRTAGEGDEWWDSVYEDAENMAAILGIELARKNNERSPAISFSGFSSQGDGACFEGSYRYKKGALKTLQAEAPTLWTDPGGVRHQNKGNFELQRIAHALQEVQRKHFYQLEATCTHRGHYYHSGCMHVEVNHAESLYRDIGDAEEEVRQLLRDFADWIYQRLEDEYDWLNADEQVDESIRANEYTFTESGRRED